MQATSHLPKPSIQQVVDHIFAARKITRADQRCLMAAAMSECSISSNERQLVDRVFAALQQGLLRVVD